MIKTDKDLSFLHHPNYLDLSAYYLDHPIALYAGAGVSKSGNPAFGVGLWDEFVRSILVLDGNVNPETVEAFDKNKSKWKDKPWEMAEWVAYKIGYDAFERHVTAIIQRKENFQEKYKLLSGKFLENARTLNSLVAFCAGLSGGKIAEDSKGQQTAVYRRSINQRVRAIVTSNYDPFLEAASATMFRKPILKPVAARGSSVGTLVEIPVFHIHGYVPIPYKFRKQGTATPTPFVDPVITTSDYKSAWKANNVYNFTMGPQIHILRHYAVLFIGFSFRDKWVNHLLTKLNEERRDRKDRLYHYALLWKDEIDARGAAPFFDELGVKTIPLDNHSQIKDLLGHLYQQALVYDHAGEVEFPLPPYAGRGGTKPDRPVCLTPADYFEELYHCRLSMVRRKRPSTGPDS